MGSNVPNIPTDPNMGAAQQGAMGGISSMASATPQYQALYNAQASNPYAGQAIAGAQAGGQAMQQQGQQNINTANMFAGIPGQLSPAVAATLSTAYDPQQQLYSQERQQAIDTANAQNAASGLGFTPWGAGVTNQATTNFDTNWIQTQLGREQTGASTIAQLLGAGEGAAASGASLGAQGAGQIAQGAALPYATQTTMNQNLQPFLSDLTANQQQMAQDYLNYYGAANANTANAISAGAANNQYMTGIGQGIGGLAGLGALAYLL